MKGLADLIATTYKWLKGMWHLKRVFAYPKVSLREAEEIAINEVKRRIASGEWK